MFIAPRWFQRDVQLIDRDWFVCWNPYKERWQIRMWRVDSPFDRKINTDFPTIARKSVAIETVCFYDENFTKDIGYKPLDQRTLHSLRISRKNAENPDYVLKQIDDANAKLDEEWDKEISLMAKEVAVADWKHRKELFVDFGAR